MLISVIIYWHFILFRMQDAIKNQYLKGDFVDIKGLISCIWQNILMCIKRDYAAEISNNDCWKKPDTGKIKGSH
jgi:hypothetical protein